MTAVDVVIMAAGKGTRMKSQLPKVLHRLAGRALVQHVIDTAHGLRARQMVLITGHGAPEVEAALTVIANAGGHTVPTFVRQEPQLGTGHAVQQAVPVLADDGITLILNGDVPLIEAATLRSLITQCNGTRLALLTVDMPDPSGYGRIVRFASGASGAEPRVQAIVEHKDATAEQRAITEVYTGVMALPNSKLKAWLARLTNDNAQREFYLTDIVKFAVDDGDELVTTRIDDKVQVDGVNSPVQLAELERAFQHRQARALMDQGVRLADPARFDLRGQLRCGQDVEIDINCVIEGRVTLGDNVRVGAHCVIANADIHAGAVIHPFTHIDGGKEGVVVGEGALIGPFARLRPGAQLGPEVEFGPFDAEKGLDVAHIGVAGEQALRQRLVGRHVGHVHDQHEVRPWRDAVALLHRFVVGDALLEGVQHARRPGGPARSPPPRSGRDPRTGARRSAFRIATWRSISPASHSA
jgi:bifunctional UDP-N-acetylglucosamine pyrophosphorylase/glucosamine-1-phosphate N-acetyltransferase